ncbi:MAG: DUF4382 domain-containing protein [Gemmatimonadales bacterium]|nr:DUF4382 domain-containing protein [Gemmatimonadales bacterium]
MRVRATIPILAGVALLAAAASGCYQDESSGPGNTKPIARVLLTDAPFPFDTVESVNIYIVSVAASVTADTSEPGGQEWITITEPKRQVDLLTLQQGTTTLVGEGELDAAQYRAIRVIIDTDSSNIKFIDGSEATVDWGGPALQSIHAFVEAALAIPAGSVSEIVIDFDVGRSFHWNDLGDNAFNFIPWIRAVNEAATGSIAGTVQGDATPLANAIVTAYGATEGTWMIRSTGKTNASGFYRLAYLLPGTYIVQVDPPSPGFESNLDSSVTVAVGLETPHHVNLGNFNGSILIQGAQSMLLGATNELQAFVVDADHQPVANPTVLWLSLDTGVVAVTDSGRAGELAWVTARAIGSSRITATSGSLSDTLTIFVAPDSSGGPSGRAVQLQRRR